MDIVNEARELLPKCPTNIIIEAYNKLGIEYLGGEAVYYNNFDGMMELIEDFELENYDILYFIVNNVLYKNTDKYIFFDGHTLESINNLGNIIKTVEKKMNGEVANYLIESIKMVED